MSSKLLIFVLHLLDGTGYIEDGRDIFDDDELEPQTSKSHKKNKTESKKRARVSDNITGNASIRNMFSNVSYKKKEVKISFIK